MMMIKLQRIFLLLICLIAFVFSVNAQYASRELSKKQQAYIDSLKQVEYNYMLPVWGQQAYKKGFDIPYPVGAMGNFIWMDQGIVIENFELGIQNDNTNIPLTPLDDLIGFGRNTNVSYAVNFRPDVWVFPFLNVYGLFGYGSSTTEVVLTKPVELVSSVTQSIQTNGFGVMSGFGLGKFWASVDANWTWTKPELLEDAVLAKVLGLRLGRTLQFASHPERNVAFWIGGMRARMSSETVGAVLMKDAIPQETWDRVDEIEAQWNEFLEEYPIFEGGAFDEFIKALTANDGETLISYAMDKRPEQEWNVVFGGQFQLNKRWQFRTEAGLIGDRKSFLASVNYRFLL
jgi:hypothetical protein